MRTYSTYYTHLDIFQKQLEKMQTAIKNIRERVGDNVFVPPAKRDPFLNSLDESFIQGNLETLAEEASILSRIAASRIGHAEAAREELHKELSKETE